MSAPIRVDPSAGQQRIETAGGEHVIITPLGSGGEVGRSCILVQHRNRKVMLDCGIHPAKSGLDALPLFDAVSLQDVDACFVTHFHLDHCGGLPYLCEQTGFKGRVVMTHPTRSFYKMVMSDFMRIGAGANDIVNSDWLHSTLERIETIEYHQDFVHNGVRVVALNAGHVLGAAMFLVDLGGVRVLYTGDYSIVPDRHLLGAEHPPISPDILIVESTYGIQIHETREEREEKFTRWVEEIVLRGGRCLIPVFALGRAQELLLILEEHWEANQQLQRFPIYYASSLAARCMNLYRTYGSAMNERVKVQLDNNTNPFDFKFIRSLKDLSSFEDNGPSVVLASPGMMQSGVSLELFERWCGDSRNGVIVAGYCVDGTLAKTVLGRPKEVPKANDPNNAMLPVKMKTIESVSFSAHSDGQQTCAYIDALRDTKHVVLVHGNEDSGNKLQARLNDRFRSRGLKAYTTKNAQPVSIPFTKQRTATMYGQVAAVSAALHQEAQANALGLELNTTGAEVIASSNSTADGVLVVGANHSCSIVSPAELPQFTGLALTHVRHATHVQLGTFVPASDVLAHLQAHFSATCMVPAGTAIKAVAISKAVSPSGVGAEADENEDGAEEAEHDDDEDQMADVDGAPSVGKPERITVGKGVTVDVVQSALNRTSATVSWDAATFADMLADVAVVALIALGERAAGGPEAHRSGGHVGMATAVTLAAKDAAFRHRNFQRLLCQQFEGVRVNLSTGDAFLQLPAATRGRASYPVHVVGWVDARVLDPSQVDELTDPSSVDGTIGEPLAEAVQVDRTARSRLQALLRRSTLALNPIPTDEPTGSDGVAAFLDRGGWCDCNDDSHHPTPAVRVA